jgi:thioredoxin-dependent peroxiredoxin
VANLPIGSKAPDFELQDQNGTLVRLSEVLKEKSVVLYFYPKDETPGCTKEACAFRDQYEAFLDNGAEVIGVSQDSVASHKAFAQKRNLPFMLLSDPNFEVHKRYEANPKFLGILRARITFVIDQTGTIQHVFESQLNFLGHIEESLAVLKRIQAPTT